MCMLFPWMSVFDIGTCRANFIKPIKVNNVSDKYSDFSVLIPIFNDIKYLTNLEYLKKYADKVILCTTTNETDKFINDLEELSAKYGFRISYSPVGDGKKNPWAIYNKTLLAHDAVLRSSIRTLTSEYVIFMDGDTFVDGDLETLTGIMEDKGYDLASVKILPTKRENLIEKLQGVEYDIAMQARLIYPWLTSGAGMIAKKSVMNSIMMNHSLFFNGGDIEIGKLADKMGYHVGHIPMVFYTDIPNTFMKWVKQRFSWMCGCFRHSIVNFDHNLQHPFHFLYFSLIIYFLFPVKFVNMLSHWYLIPLLIVFYAVLTYFANWKVRSKYMLIFPFYALFQVMVILWFGIYRYVKTVIKTRNFGRINVVYNPNNVSVFNPLYSWKILKSYILSFVGAGVLLLGTSNPIQEAVLKKNIDTIDLAKLAYAKLYEEYKENTEVIEPVVLPISYKNLYGAK